MNWSAALGADVPVGALTVTCTVPLPAGVVVVIWVSETKLKATLVVPNRTLLTPVNPLPVIVTPVPPTAAPVAGVRPVTGNAGLCERLCQGGVTRRKAVPDPAATDHRRPCVLREIRDQEACTGKGVGDDRIHLAVGEIESQGNARPRLRA